MNLSDLLASIGVTLLLIAFLLNLFHVKHWIKTSKFVILNVPRGTSSHV